MDVLEVVWSNLMKQVRDLVIDAWNIYKSLLGQFASQLGQHTSTFQCSQQYHVKGTLYLKFGQSGRNLDITLI